MEIINGLITLGAILGLALALFLIFRQFVLWYFRINEMADNLAVLAQQARNQNQPASAFPVQRPPATPAPSRLPAQGASPNPRP